jgi:hypothetical protein
MPALKLYDPPVEAAKPAARRVWAYPDLRSHSLLVLTPGAIYLAPYTGAPKPEVVEAAEGEGDLDEMFGPLATIIDLAAIRRAYLDLLTNTITIDVVRSQHAASRIALTFATPQAADSCFSRIWRRLGDGFTLHSHKAEGGHSLRLPLVVLALVLAITAAVALAAHAADDLPARAATTVNVPGEERPTVVPRSVQRLFGWMDWRAVCLAGGAAAAASQVWLYRRLTQPPLALEVIRS